MGYSIATRGESLPMLDQTNNRHICSLQDLVSSLVAELFSLIAW